MKFYLLENRNLPWEAYLLRIKDAYNAYYYARDVIRGRWPEAEEFIKKNPEYAFRYAAYVIKDRWPEAEEYIKKHPEQAYLYAKYVIKGRWPEAEECIIKNSSYLFISQYMYLYAVDIIKGRWPEAEKIILGNDDYYKREYLKLICEECKGNGVIDLGIGGAEEECTQCNGGGFDKSAIKSIL